MTRTEFLIASVLFLVLLAFIIWIVSLFKAKAAPGVFRNAAGAHLDDLTENELELARADLLVKSRALRNTKELIRVRADLAQVEARLKELSDNPENPKNSPNAKNPA